jgi:hypothetical protein
MKKRVKEKRDLLVIRNPVSFREGATEQGEPDKRDFHARLVRKRCLSGSDA